MSEAGKDHPERDSSETVSHLLDQWAEALVQVVESMTDQRPALEWRKDCGPPPESGTEADLLWWEQPFQISPAAKAWVAAPRAAWEYLGTLTLKAAGLDTGGSDEARNTWFETLGQSLSGMARSIGVPVGLEVNCDAGVERAPVPEARQGRGPQRGARRAVRRRETSGRRSAGAKRASRSHCPWESPYRRSTCRLRSIASFSPACDIRHRRRRLGHPAPAAPLPFRRACLIIELAYAD